MANKPMRGVLHHLRRASALRDAAELTDGQLLDRFLSRRDEPAFEALVKRHGSMVLGVCRRLLGNAADADDAFQATFLVLVRKAHAIRPRELVGNWLYGVAYRTALRAKSAAAQRRAKERQVPPMSRAESPPDETWADVQPLLDRELNGLPEKYRVPIVLCDLQGKTRREAARQLDWPEGTLSCRLARGRALLVQRLARYGLTFSGATLALGLSQGTAAAVPSALLSTTVRAALAGAAALPNGVASLAEGVLKAMLLTRLKIGAALVAAVGLVISGLAVVRSPAATEFADVKKVASAPAVVKTLPRPHRVAGNDDLKEWVLDFQFHDPRLVQADVPGKGQGPVWYLHYKISNLTPAAHRFIPDFALLIPGQAAARHDEVMPPVEKKIARLEDPAQTLKHKNSITIAQEVISPRQRDGQVHAVHGLALWADVPADVKALTITVSGLTNTWQREVVPGTKRNSSTVTVLRKVLQLHFRREGKEMRFVPPAEWVFRESPRAVTSGQQQPPRRAEKAEKMREIYLRALSEAHEAWIRKKAEDAKIARELYLRELSEARAAWEQAGVQEFKKSAIQKALRQIDEGLRDLRRHMGSEQAELRALDEMMRSLELLKSLRRLREDQHKGLEKLEGLWMPKKVEFGSSKLPLEILGGSLSPPSAVAILGDRFLTRTGKDLQKIPTIRLHLGRRPAGIDFHVGGKVIRATYELQGETLRIRIGDSELTYQRKQL